MNKLINQEQLNRSLDVIASFVSKKDFDDIDWNDNTVRSVRMAEQVITTANRIESMPSTIEQSGKGDDAIAFVSYLDPNSEKRWYVTEKDTDDGQFQVFGAMKQDNDSDLITGIIPLQEVLAKNYYLDLNF